MCIRGECWREKGICQKSVFIMGNGKAGVVRATDFPGYALRKSTVFCVAGNGIVHYHMNLNNNM